MTAIVVVALAALSAAACESKQETLVSLKSERRALLDELYARYGGGALSNEIKRETDAESARAASQPPTEGSAAGVELLRTLSGAVGEVDRAAFEEQCETVGAGDRPVIFHDKGRAFFAEGATRSTCTRVAQLSMRIATLERELSTARPSGATGASER